MNTIKRTLGRVAAAGTARSAVILIVLFYLWWRFQIGGLNDYVLNGWLVLALPLVVAAMGVTLLIIMGEFDLSAAGVVTLVNVLLATTFSHTNSLLAAIVLIAIGALIGLANGALVVYAKLPAIAVTLATLIILNGIALVKLATPGGVIPAGVVNTLTGRSTVPRALIVIVLLALGWLVVRRTRLGTYIFALGADSDALALSGIAINKARIATFAIAGALYGFAGVCLGAAIQTGDASAGSTYLLSTFAAIAIGGTAFVGGSGTAIGSILGALILTIIPKVLFVLGISDWVQTIFTGVLIILAVLAGAIGPKEAGAAIELRSGRRRRRSTQSPNATRTEAAA
jgi:ribose transport system permease protein